MTPLVAGFATVLVLLLTSGVLVGASPGIVDTDGFMRLVRVDELRTGAVGWFDSWAPRSNAPFGHSMHWTRPLDLLLLALALPLEAFGQPREALELAALSVGPLVMAVVAATVVWAAVPLVGRVGALVAGLGVALQPALAQYGAVGRVDHHGLILLLAAVLLGFTVRLVNSPGDHRLAVAAGVTAAIGLWVSTEFLLPIAIFLSALLVAWVVTGAPEAVTMRRVTSAWAVGLGVILLIERGGGAVGSDDLDRVSAVHLVVAGLALAFWFLVGASPVVGTRWVRSGLAVAAGLATGAVLWLVVPGFANGPFGDVPPELWDAWLSRVAELQPLWPIGVNPARTVYLLAAPILAVLVSVWAALRSDHRGTWWSLAAVTFGLTLLGVAQARFTAFAQLASTVPLGWLAATLVARVGTGGGVVGAAKRVSAMVVGVAGFLVPVLVVSVISGGTSPASAGASCEIDLLVNEVERRSDGVVVLTHVDWGPEILYRTEGTVVASPYHRNVDGILDARRFFTSEPTVARRIAADRNVGLVALCLDRDSNYLADDRQPGDLLTRITGDETPSWLVEVVAEQDLRVFEVAQPLGTDS